MTTCRDCRHFQRETDGAGLCWEGKRPITVSVFPSRVTCRGFALANPPRIKPAQRKPKTAP